MASEKQQQKLSPAADNPRNGGQGDETVADTPERTDSVTVSVVERVVERDNLCRALNQVKRNKGGPGIDGLTVERIPDYLKVHWPVLRRQLLNGSYRPVAVKQVLTDPGVGRLPASLFAQSERSK